MPNELNPLGTKRSARLAAEAARQWGCVTVADLLGAGYTRREIHRMVERGLLIRIHRGVYVVGALIPAPEQRWAAGVLFGGKGAALMHTAAAGNFGLMLPREVIEVAAPRKRRGDETVRVHERRSIAITQHNGIPTTTVAQTLLDPPPPTGRSTASRRKQQRRDSSPSMNSGRSRQAGAEHGAPPDSPTPPASRSSEAGWGLGH
jgi:hypothetical protein